MREFANNCHNTVCRKIVPAISMMGGFTDYDTRPTEKQPRGRAHQAMPTPRRSPPPVAGSWATPGWGARGPSPSSSCRSAFSCIQGSSMDLLCRCWWTPAFRDWKNRGRLTARPGFARRPRYGACEPSRSPETTKSIKSSKFTEHLDRHWPINQSHRSSISRQRERPLSKAGSSPRKVRAGVTTPT
jgi:hypothetical protein